MDGKVDVDGTVYQFPLDGSLPDGKLLHLADCAIRRVIARRVESVLIGPACDAMAFAKLELAADLVRYAVKDTRSPMDMFDVLPW